MSESWEKTWPQYVRRHSGAALVKEIGENAGVHPSTVGRWLPAVGRPKRPDGDHVVKFARAYRRPPVEALIAAGYLQPNDISDNDVIELGASLSDVSADELLKEVRRRIPDDRAAASTADGDHLGERYLEDLGNPGGGDRLKQRSKRA